MTLSKTLLNAALFQLGWFCCLYSGDHPWLLWLAGGALLLHFVYISSWREEGRLVATVMLLGATLDSFLLTMGVFDFAGHERIVPLWLALLWALLGTTLNHSLAWSTQPWWRASLLGAISGPLSYIAGSKLAGVGLPLGIPTTWILLAVIWAILLPLLHGFARLYRERLR